MGFKQVFYTLREVFPQVDLRILKAVAGQYSSDVDAAVEFVLSDVLPAVSEPTEAHYTLQDIDYAKNDHENSCTNGDFPGKNPSLGYGRPLYDNILDGCSFIEDKVVVNETIIAPTIYDDQVGPSSVSASKPPILDCEQSALTAFVNHCAMEKENMLPQVEKLANKKHSNGIYNLQDSLSSSGSMLPLQDQSPSDSTLKYKGKMALKLPKAESTQDLVEDNGNEGKELDLLHTAKITHMLENNLQGKPCTTNTTTHVTRFLIHDDYQKSSYKLDDQSSLSELFTSSKIVNDSQRTFEEKGSLNTVDKGEKHYFTFPDICNKVELSSSTRNVSLSGDSECRMRGESEGEIIIMCLNSADKHAIVPLIVHDTDKYKEYPDITTQSYEISRINKLIADVTNTKEALSSLYELMKKKMNEVELQEENLRKAKEEAAQAHQGFITIVENYNKLIENSRESNIKKAEIVRGEKSLLATLAQNLQSRLSKLSAERDDVLTIVEKINFELDARLATSIEEETAAREHISQEENLSLLVSEEKEAEIGSIMEESMKLQKEAEENILLRKCLTDCGHAIDILQGEISSIREKVVALKENTHRSKLQSALVTTNSSSTSSDMPECKTLSPDRHWQLENQDKSGILSHEKTPDSHAKDRVGLSDDEWEMLETTSA